MGFGFKREKYGPIPWLHRGVLVFFLILGGSLFHNIYSVTLSENMQASEKIEAFLVATSGISKERSSAAYTLSKALETEGTSLSQDNVTQLLDHVATADLSLIRSQYDHPEFLQALQEGAGFKEDILSLLGFTGPQTYIIALQNTGEKRPNGGFFGSFALVTFDQGRLKEFEMVDSYLPGHNNPSARITGPQRLQEFLPDRLVYFIGANKIGFTYHDGGHIKTLYEKSYPGKKIRGVVFVTTDFFEELLPGFKQQLWQWQFTNAAVDLIRGNDSRGKKELYIEGSQEYFRENAPLMMINLFKNIETIRKKHDVNMYLTDITGPMHGYLRRNNLTTRFESDTMYFWESNISFNKIDRFVQKNIVCNTTQGTVAALGINERVTIGLLPPGNYTCSVDYMLDVPQEYRDAMASFEKQFGVTLTEREEHILGLDPERNTRGIVYYPSSVTVTSISGDGYDDNIFTTPFSNALTYKVWLGGEQKSKRVVMELVVE